MTMTTERLAPTENLVRCVPFELRAKGGEAPTMSGHFAVFDEWTEISSWFEGDFLERIAPGAFAGVFARGDAVKVLYDHGYDPAIGNKPLGKVTSLTEDARGAHYEVALFDSSYVRDLLPALRAGELGASFRFRVAEHLVVDEPGRSDHNPKGLPERTITRIDPLYEFGPVTFPAYSGATAGVRSGTDQFFDRLLGDARFVARLTERLGPRIVAQMIDDGAAGDAPARHHTAQSHAADGPDASALVAVPESTLALYHRALSRPRLTFQESK